MVPLCGSVNYISTKNARCWGDINKYHENIPTFVLLCSIDLYIPPTIQFVLGKRGFKYDKIPPMGKNAPLEGKMLIKYLPKQFWQNFNQ